MLNNMQSLPSLSASTSTGPPILSSLDCLPDNVLLNIFQMMKRAKDFYALATLNKHLFAFSKIPLVCNCKELIPSYIANTTDPVIQQLPTWEKIYLAVQIEQKLLSKDPLPIIFQETFPTKKSFCDPFIKTMAGDYLVFTSNIYDQQRIIHVHNFKTKNQQSFQTDHTSRIVKCVIVQAPTPCLVTVGRKDGFKIWDLHQLLTSQKECRPIFHYAVQVGDERPVIETRQHLFGFANDHEVLIFDCAQLPLLACSSIMFRNCRQMQFYKDRFMLVSDRCLAIWNMSTIREALVTQQKVGLDSVLTLIKLKKEFLSCFGETKSLFIKFAKIYKDKVLIAYRESYMHHGSFIIGEIRYWATGIKCGLIYTKYGLRGRPELCSVDFQGHFMFGGSSNINKWDLELESELPVFDHRQWENQIHKVYVLGRHVLFAADTLIISRATDLTRCVHKSVTSKYQPLHSFDLYGRYLLVETEESHYSPLRKYRHLIVYDLVSVN